MNNISLSIAIPTYNRKFNIKQLVLKIKNQISINDEIIVSDDFSDDGTYDEIIKINGVKVYRNDFNLGMVNNWNKCIEYAKNDWICIIHDDDDIYENGLNIIKKACNIIKAPCIIVPSYSYKYKYDDNEFIYEYIEQGANAVIYATSTPSGCTIHRNIFNNLGLYKTEYLYSPDLEFFPRISKDYPTIKIKNPQIIRSSIHKKNYEFKTWRKDDFIPQLYSIEYDRAKYANLNSEATKYLVATRMKGHLKHMYKYAKINKDIAVIIKVARLLINYKLIDILSKIQKLKSKLN